MLEYQVNHHVFIDIQVHKTQVRMGVHFFISDILNQIKCIVICT